MFKTFLDTAGVEDNTLLQTIQSIIFNNVNRKSKNVRILFDNGAKKSSINKKLSDALGLLPVKLLKCFESENEMFLELDISRQSSEIFMGKTQLY